MRKRREDTSDFDVLLIGTDAEWREMLEWMWAQPKLPQKLVNLESVLAYHYGAGDLSVQLDKDQLAHVHDWSVTVTTKTKMEEKIEEKKPWWRFW